MTQEKFATIYHRAVERKGGERNLESLLSKPLTQEALLQIPDDRWLAVFTMKVFQCGISWQVVRNKWDNFEEVFFGFKPELLLMLCDEQWEDKARDPRIIRHLTKVMTIPANARMLINTGYEHGSFSKMVADWPEDNTTGLWEYLKKHGKRLGGNTGAYALRQAGVDTFLLSSDVEAYLRNTGIIDSGKTTARAMKAADTAFTQWRRESGRSLTEISQIIAFSRGENRI